MSLDAIKCPKCRQALPDNVLNQDIQNCPFCSKQVSVTVFPSLFRKNDDDKTTGEQTGEGESSCFYHDNLNATVHCEVCGRFLCDLCRVDMNEKDICPNCIMNNRDTDKVGDLEKRRPLHHRSALLAAALGIPLSLFFVCQIVAIIYAIKSFSQKTAVYNSGVADKVCSVFAILASVIGVGIGLFLWGRIFFN